MRVCIFGLGLSGKAARVYLERRGDEVIGLDGPDVFDPKGVDLVVKSPGVALSHPWVQIAYSHKIPVIGEVDLGLAELKKRGKTVFGITGSNGKTTTTLLTAHLLNCAGISACAVGNVGVPLISQVERDDDVFVLELSSFQLETIVPLPVLEAAVILNITPNHLDRHKSIEEYTATKHRISLCLKEGAYFYDKRKYLRYKEKVETILPLEYRDNLYPHDIENLCAAYALSRVPDECVANGIGTFKRPAHRLEVVRKIGDVTFINDSKATSVDAVIKAVLALKAPLVLLCGGVDKGGSYRDWIPYFRDRVVHVFAFGESSERIYNELHSSIAVERVCSLKTGVLKAAQIAPKGAMVVLSPGCSSYDQFRDYQERGEKFRQIIEEQL